MGFRSEKGELFVNSRGRNNRNRCAVAEDLITPSRIWDMDLVWT